VALARRKIPVAVPRAGCGTFYRASAVLAPHVGGYAGLPGKGDAVPAGLAARPGADERRWGCRPRLAEPPAASATAHGLPPGARASASLGPQPAKSADAVPPGVADERVDGCADWESRPATLPVEVEVDEIGLPDGLP